MDVFELEVDVVMYQIAFIFLHHSFLVSVEVKIDSKFDVPFLFIRE